MTLRDYFIAHAPETPWPFYEPSMPTKPDRGPPVGEDGKEYENWQDAERETFDCWHWKNQSAVNEWESEKARQYWIQWPAFWADAMLKERTK